MEGDFHVEVPHSPKSGDDTGQATAPLGPSGAVVKLEQNQSNIGVSATNSFLERIPSGGVLE